MSDDTPPSETPDTPHAEETGLFRLRPVRQTRDDNAPSKPAPSAKKSLELARRSGIGAMGKTLGTTLPYVFSGGGNARGETAYQKATRENDARRAAYEDPVMIDMGTGDIILTADRDETINFRIRFEKLRFTLLMAAIKHGNSSKETLHDDHRVHAIIRFDDENLWPKVVQPLNANACQWMVTRLEKELLHPDGSLNIDALTRVRSLLPDDGRLNGKISAELAYLKHHHRRDPNKMNIENDWKDPSEKGLIPVNGFSDYKPAVFAFPEIFPIHTLRAPEAVVRGISFCTGGTKYTIHIRDQDNQPTSEFLAIVPRVDNPRLDPRLHLSRHGALYALNVIEDGLPEVHRRALRATLIRLRAEADCLPQFGNDRFLRQGLRPTVTTVDLNL